MINWKTLYIDGKEVKRLNLNGPRAIFCKTPDFTTTVNDYWGAYYAQHQESLGIATYTDPRGATVQFWYFNGPEIGVSTGKIQFADLSYGSKPWLVAADGQGRGVFATAWHYGVSNLPTGEIQIGSTTAYISSWTNLRDWALLNGWTEEQLMPMAQIGDIAIAFSSTTNAQPTQAPYFVKESTLQELCWNANLRGCAAFKVPYWSDYSIPCQPVVLGANYAWNTPHTNANLIPDRCATLKTLASMMPQTYLARTGDSGKPIFVMAPAQYPGMSEDLPIVVSQNTTEIAGPNFPACFEVLKAYCESNNVELKEYMAALLPQTT